MSDSDVFHLDNGARNLIVSGLGRLLAEYEAEAKTYGDAEARKYHADPAEIKALRDRIRYGDGR